MKKNFIIILLVIIAIGLLIPKTIGPIKSISKTGKHVINTVYSSKNIVKKDFNSISKDEIFSTYFKDIFKYIF